MSAPSRSFSFDALRADGGWETGVMQAATREEVAGLIRSRGAFTVEVRELSGDPESRSRVTPDDLAAGLRSLATLLGAGLPVSRALAVADELVPASWTAALRHIREGVARGTSMADALETSSLPLPPEVLGIIRAGEQGSGLHRAMESAAALLETRASTRAALVSALTYPAILAVAGSASVLLLIVVVLPRFAALFTESGQSLPAATRLLLAVGRIVPSVLIPGVVFGVVAFVAWRAWVARAGARQRWHHFLLGTPTIGKIRHTTATGRACSTLAVLLEGGVPLPEAIDHAGPASGDSAVAARLAGARRRLLAGEPLAAALRSERALTPTALRLVRIGEETGELASLLGHAGRIEAEHALRSVQRLIRLLEPAMIVAFGGMVMLVAAALLQAMYGLAP